MCEKNILLLGSSGRISEALIEKLAVGAYHVDLMGRTDRKKPGIRFFPWDLTAETDCLPQGLRTAYDAVIVSAWVGNAAAERNDAAKNMACAVGLKEQILRILAAARVGQVILLGSQAEYGAASGIVTEEFCVAAETLSAYGSAKRFLYESLWTAMPGISLAELRFHSVFGFSARGGQMLQAVMRQMLHGETVSFYADGTHYCDFVCAEDAASAVMAALAHSLDGIYNISSGLNWRFSEYMHQVNQIAAGGSKLIYGEKATDSVAFSSEKFRRCTGWHCEYTFEQAIRKMLAEIRFDEIKNAQVILYGAGYCGLFFSDLLREIGIRPSCFFDKKEEKTGMQYHGIAIQKPEPASDAQTVVILCVLNQGCYGEIRQNLQALGYHTVYSVFDFKESERLFQNQPLIFFIPNHWRQERAIQLAAVSALLSDETSRKTYDEILRFLSGEPSRIPALPMESQYFAYDVYQKNPEEVFLDCGAFRGDILQFFHRNQAGRYKAYYAVEPDSANIERIAALPEAADDRVTLLETALSDKAEPLRLRNYLNENSVIREDGELKVTAVTVDMLCEAYHIVPTFLKIDVEGYEEKLLLGAEKTLLCNQPLLAVAIYHKCDDLWRLPLQIKKLLPQHTLYLRSYMNVNETILYAVPQGRLINEIS